MISSKPLKIRHKGKNKGKLLGKRDEPKYLNEESADKSKNQSVIVIITD